MQLALSMEFQKQAAKQQQMVTHLRQMIVEGTLPPGSKLPSTRSLSQQLKVSRGSVVNAYQHLQAEGYVETQTASATFVSRQLPESFIQAKRTEIVPVTAPPISAARIVKPRTAALRLYNPEQD